MKNKNNIIVFVTLFTLIILSRWASHLWNFTIVGGALLFAGAYFKDKKISIALMLSSMLVSDLIIGFHNQMISVYFALLLMTILGHWLQTEQARLKVLGFAFLGSFLFYAITNFAVWYSGDLYTKDFNGLIQCFIMAVPFYKNQLASDLISSFALFELARQFKLFSIQNKVEA